MTLDPSLYGPKDYWAISPNLEPDHVLMPGDALYRLFVETARARGEFSFDGLLVEMDVNPDDHVIRSTSRERQYLLFVGHRGSGKSTELRRLAEQLHHPKGFFVVLQDAATELNLNDLQYADVLFAFAQNLCERLEREGVELEGNHLQELRGWFREEVITFLEDSILSAELKTGIETGVSVPLLGKLFASLTTAVRFGSTRKKELRDVVKNSFTRFASAFNRLIADAGAAVARQGKGRQILFVMDGGDRLSGEDAKDFFVEDVHQLQQIHGRFIYCAPIHMLADGNALQQRYDYIHRIPMLKLHERDGSKVEHAYATMREMVYRRIHPDLFESSEMVDELIRHSGGHPRDLVRLLGALRRESRDRERFHPEALRKAFKSMAMDFQRILMPEDFALLKAIDARPDEQHNHPRISFLLNNLAILEYNSYWWRSHPLVQTLPGYQRAQPLES